MTTCAITQDLNYYLAEQDQRERDTERADEIEQAIHENWAVLSDALGTCMDENYTRQLSALINAGDGDALVALMRKSAEYFVNVEIDELMWCRHCSRYEAALSLATRYEVDVLPRTRV